MDSAFAAWLKSTFVKRRWILLTPTSLFVVPGFQWLMNHFSSIPTDLRTASVWQAPWWLYALSLMGCLNVSQIFSWNEQYKSVRTLSGRPEVTVIANYNGSPEGSFIFVLQNSSIYVAVNISARDIVLPYPERTRLQEKELEVASGISFPLPRDNAWTVKFVPVDRLAGGPGEFADLDYTVDAGLLRPKNLCLVFGEYSEAMEVNIPFTLVFSNLGDPRRTWHSHYIIEHRVGSKRITMNHIAYEELAKGQVFCSRCL